MKSYSIDLRKRVVRYREQGYSAQELSERFSISKRTVERYWERYQEEGHYNERQRGGYKISRLKGHDKLLKRWVSQNPGITLEQLQQCCLKELGLKISLNPIWRRLKYLGLSYKKNDMRKRAKAS